MKVKDFKPKYQKIEVIISEPAMMPALFGVIGTKSTNFENLIEMYGEYEILEVEDSDAERFTLIRIEKEYEE